MCRNNSHESTLYELGSKGMNGIIISKSGYQAGVGISKIITLSLPLPFITASVGCLPRSLLTWYPECQYLPAHLDHPSSMSVLLLHHERASYSSAFKSKWGSWAFSIWLFSLTGSPNDYRGLYNSVETTLPSVLISVLWRKTRQAKWPGSQLKKCCKKEESYKSVKC